MNLKPYVFLAVLAAILTGCTQGAPSADIDIERPPEDPEPPFNVTVENTGAAPSTGATVQTVLDGTVIASQSYSSLAAGESTTYTVTEDDVSETLAEDYPCGTENGTVNVTMANKLIPEGDNRLVRERQRTSTSNCGSPQTTVNRCVISEPWSCDEQTVNVDSDYVSYTVRNDGVETVTVTNVSLTSTDRRLTGCEAYHRGETVTPGEAMAVVCDGFTNSLSDTDDEYRLNASITAFVSRLGDDYSRTYEGVMKGERSLSNAYFLETNDSVALSNNVTLALSSVSNNSATIGVDEVTTSIQAEKTVVVGDMVVTVESVFYTDSGSAENGANIVVSSLR